MVSIADVFGRDPRQPPVPGLATAHIRAIVGEKDSPVFNQTLLKRFVNLIR